MAIDYINVSTMSRSNGANAIELAAYRSNACLFDEQIGKTFNYTLKSDCVSENILLPNTAFIKGLSTAFHPFNDREKLWNSVELKENGHNRAASAQVAYEIKLALPKELDLKDNIRLVNEFVYDHYVSKFNIAADICIHDKGDGNPHAHVMLTTRSINGDELNNKKDRNIINKNRDSIGIVFKKEHSIADVYREYQNTFFKENNLNISVDQNKIFTGIHMRRSRHDKGFLQVDINKNNETDHKNLDALSKDHNIIIDTLSNRQSTFNHGDIQSLILKCTIADRSKYQEVLDKVMSSPRLLDLGVSAFGKQTFTSKENYRKDIQLIELYNDLSGRRSINIGQIGISMISHEFTLREEQKAALKYISHMGDLSCIVGYAGAGKSHTLKAINALYKAKGIDVSGAAISGKVAQSLSEDTSINSRTIASMLLSYKNQSDNVPKKGSVLVIDEAGMVGLDDMVDIMKMSQERALKLVLVGDPNQLEAISKGSPFKTIIDDVGFTPMKDIVRQKNTLDRQASIDLAEGKVGLAIDHYDAKKQVHFASSASILDSLVNKYSEYLDQHKMNDTLVLSYSRKDVAEANKAIRGLLVSRNSVSIGDKFQVSSGNGNKELRFSVGEKIVFLRNGTVEGKEGVKNGLFGNITSIDKSTLTIRTQEGDSSRYIKVDTSKYNSLDYGYATTVHKSQGTTIDNTIMYINSKGWNKNLSYVGMSRHKYNLDMYVNKDVYGGSDILKRSLSSNSRKELDVSKFIERKPTEAFIGRLKSGIRGSSFQIK